MAYCLASDLQRQNTLLVRVERTIEEGRNREGAASELLQTQLDFLERELSGTPIEDLELRLFRARRSVEFFERAWGMAQAHQIARLRVTLLTNIKNGQN